MPLAYLIADKLGSIQDDGLPAPAPYSTNLLIDDILNHKLDATALRENPKGLGQIFADGTIIKISNKKLKPIVGRVVAYPLSKQKPFSTLNEAKSSLSSEVYNSDYKEAFIGDTIIDIELIYSTNKKTKKFTIQSLLNPGLTKQEQTANLIINHTNKKPSIYRITGLLDKSVNITNSAIKAFSTFVINGFIHILEGYDHILFILCLIVGAQNLKSLFWRITGFTIGHSITISFGFFNIIPNYLWFIPFIETTIAISIVYAAFLALWGKEHKNIILITVLIGLLHGFGFSFILSEILSIDSMNLWQSLLGFNVGVELGQLLIAVIVWPCLWYFSKKLPMYQSHLKWTILLPCILIGSLWVGERAIILINSF
jgi:hydrogenase/urease accessory protein HupE